MSGFVPKTKSVLKGRRISAIPSRPHQDGFVFQGVIVGQGDTFDEALNDVPSAIRFHLKTFGRESLETENPALAAYIAEAVV